MTLKTFTKKAFLTTIFLVGISLGSCTDHFDELNTNPKLITDDDIKVELLMTRALKTAIFDMLNTDRMGEFSTFIKRGDSNNILIVIDITAPFDDYTEQLANLAAIIRLTSDDPSLKHQNAMARILRVWVYHRITDSYGDVPYSEVATSFDDITVYPAYDTQESIYQDFFKELEEAMADLQAGGDQESYGTADILFEGDTDSWARFANSLRLRLALRVRYADNALAQAQVTKALNSPLIDANELNATLITEGEDATYLTNTNPLYQMVVNGDIGSGSSVSAGFTLVEKLERTDDPRLSIYLEPNDDGDFVGGLINLTPEQASEYPARAKWHPNFREAVYDFNLIQASEVHLLLAEAALAGLAGGDANTYYRDGITLSMEQYGVEATEIDTFLSGPYGTLSGSDEEQLEMIIDQKYLALFRDPYEVFAEHRRTGYPRVWIGDQPGSDTDGGLPRRLTYPLLEYSLNPSVELAASRLSNGDKFTSRFWWDAKPGLPFSHPEQGIFPPYGE